jgi:methylthioribose-1-phosphate isomerase
MVTSEVMSIKPLNWPGETLRLLYQTRLPAEEVWLELSDYREVIAAIRDMRVRGAPAIGIAGAYAVALAATEFAHMEAQSFLVELAAAADSIAGTRPTGANLGWAVRRMLDVANGAETPRAAVIMLINEAVRLQNEDEAANLAIGRLGAALLPPHGAVLTHCNAGALATAGYGTALGVVRSAWADGKLSRVFATETRPLLQGSRLTAWELSRSGIDTTILPDSAAGQLMRRGEVQSIVVGADRIAANGDVANKIGTYSLAVLAMENGVPFYVAAPTSTIDTELPNGDAIPIEERDASEVTHLGGTRIAAEGVGALNPAFDITPNRFVKAIITEQKILQAPYGPAIAAVTEAPRG